MKNFQQTPKQRRLVMCKNKAAYSQSKKPGRTYNEPWGENKRVGNEPLDRLAMYDHTRPVDFSYWY